MARGPRFIPEPRKALCRKLWRFERPRSRHNETRVMSRQGLLPRRVLAFGNGFRPPAKTEKRSHGVFADFDQGLVSKRPAEGSRDACSSQRKVSPAAILGFRLENFLRNSKELSTSPSPRAMRPVVSCIELTSLT